AAGIYADRDPDYARHLMTCWRRSTRKTMTPYAGFNLLALGRPDLEDIELRFSSRQLEGLGVTMRANQGRPDEILGFVKSGPATHHNCNDDGGLVLYAHGVPVIGDFGYHCRHNAQTH